MQAAVATLLVLMHAGGPEPGGLPPPSGVLPGQPGPVGFPLVFRRDTAPLGGASTVGRKTVGQRLCDGHGFLGGVHVGAGGHGRRRRVTGGRTLAALDLVKAGGSLAPAGVASVGSGRRRRLAVLVAGHEDGLGVVALRRRQWRQSGFGSGRRIDGYLMCV